jgi:hypothetical protein
MSRKQYRGSYYIILWSYAKGAFITSLRGTNEVSDEAISINAIGYKIASVALLPRNDEK